MVLRPKSLDNMSSRSLVAVNPLGDVLTCREGQSATFAKSGSKPVIIHDRLAVACIAMMMLAEADFKQPIDTPSGFLFVLEFNVPRSGIRAGIIQGTLVPGQGEWLMSRFDLIVVRNRVHILNTTSAAAMLAGAVAFEA